MLITVLMTVLIAMMANSSSVAATEATHLDRVEVRIPGANPGNPPLDRTWTTGGKKTKEARKCLSIQHLRALSLFERRAWDSNPQPLAGHLISSQRYRNRNLLPGKDLQQSICKHSSNPSEGPRRDRV